MLEVLGPQEEIDVMKGLVGQQGQRLGIHDEDFLLAKFLHRDVFLGQQTVLGVIGAEFEEFLIVKGGRGHGEVNLKGIRVRATRERSILHVVRRCRER